jgi:hypothetical protein
MKEQNNAVEESFNARVGWFDRYKNRVQLHNVEPTGEEASANGDVTFT